jgi:hypothetical protein
MPIEYRVDPEARRVFTTAYGKLRYEEILDHIAASAKDPDVDPNFSELTDWRRVDSIDLTADEVVEVAREHVFAATARRAIVAPQPLYFGIARMYETHHTAGGKAIVHVFASMEEALHWLDNGTSFLS